MRDTSHILHERGKPPDPGAVPPEASVKVTFLGNTAKSGGEMLLLNRHLRAELIEMVSNVEVVELAANPAFDRAFVEAMRF